MFDCLIVLRALDWMRRNHLKGRLQRAWHHSPQSYVSATFTTIAFDDSSLRWLEIST
jgi:hypothetical protein